MTRKERVTHALFGAIDEVNQQLPKDQQVEKSLHTVLKGGAGTLDSMGMINFIVATEQKIEEEFGAEIELADSDAMSSNSNPLSSVGAFVDYVTLLLGDHDE